MLYGNLFWLDLSNSIFFLMVLTDVNSCENLMDTKLYIYVFFIIIKLLFNYYYLLLFFITFLSFFFFSLSLLSFFILHLINHLHSVHYAFNYYLLLITAATCLCPHCGLGQKKRSSTQHTVY